METGNADREGIEVVGEENYESEWSELAERLLAVSPHKMRVVLEYMRSMVEAQEVIARADGRLILRPRRPEKRYRA